MRQRKPAPTDWAGFLIVAVSTAAMLIISGVAFTCSLLGVVFSSVFRNDHQRIP